MVWGAIVMGLSVTRWDRASQNPALSLNNRRFRPIQRLEGCDEKVAESASGNG